MTFHPVYKMETNREVMYIKRKPMITLERVTIVFGLIGHLSVYIQAIKIQYLGSAYAVSLLGSLVALTSMIFWLGYGISRHIKPLVITNIFGLIGVALLIVEILYFGNASTSFFF